MTVVKMAALQVPYVCRGIRVIVVPVFLMVMFEPREISSQIAYEDPCDPRADSFGQMCVDFNTSCIRSRSGPYLCLCAAAFYRHSDGMCHEVSEVQVFNISVSVLNTTATLAWEVEDHGVNVTYTVQQYPDDGQVEEVSESGAIVTCLISESVYSFVITATLQPDLHNGKKSVQANSDIVNIGSGPERPIVYVKQDPQHGSDVLVGFQRARNDVRRRMRLQISRYTYTRTIYTEKIVMFRISSLQPDTEYNYTLTIFSATNSLTLYIQTGTLRTPSSGKLYGDICTTSEECSDAMVCGKETGTCICDGGYFNPDGKRKYCYDRYRIGRGCEPYVPNQCQEKSACVFRSDRGFSCQCDRSHYYAGGGECLPLSRLQVWNITSHVTDNTVTFKWNIFYRERGDPAIVTYGIEWTPDDSTVAAIQFGGQVSGLKPETEYNFTILTIVSDSDSTKHAAVSAGRVRTLSVSKSASMKEMETMSEVALAVAIAVACLTLLALIGLVVLLWRRKSSQFSKPGLKETQSTGHEIPSAPQSRVFNRYQTTPVQQRPRNADHDFAEASREDTDESLYEVPDTGNSFRINESNSTCGPDYFNVRK